MLPKQVLEELLAIGRGGNDCIPSSLRDDESAWRILVCGNESWIEAARDVGDRNVPDLIRGLIRYCRASGRAIGGSVSPVIVLYRIVLERAPDLESELTSWVVAHRTNPYEPFGTLNDEGATTYAEYTARQAARISRARANEQLEVDRQRQAREVKRERDRLQAAERLANAVRRGDLLAVRALLDKVAEGGTAASNGGSLVELALKNGREDVAELLKSRGVS